MDQSHLESAAVNLGAVKIDARNIGVMGSLTGVVIALREAIRLKFVPRGTDDPSYPGELTDALAGPPSDQLLAGFYFNDALYRIAATAERLCKIDNDLSRKRAHICDCHWTKTYGEDQVPIRKIRKEVNRLKHDGEGTATGRKVGMAEALAAFSIIARTARAKWGS